MLIKRGSRGNLVRQIQAKLSIGIDGKFGSITEEAVKLFQCEHQLPDHGMVDDTTWIMMFGSLPKTENTIPPKNVTSVHVSTTNSPFDPNHCICQNGFNQEIFVKCFYPERVGKRDRLGNPLPPPTLFTHVNMKEFSEARYTTIDTLLTELNQCFERYEISNCRRKAHFLAQIWWEADRFNTLQEYASGQAYDPDRRPDARANGNTQVGDGPRYKGRGCMQLTWKKNYQQYQRFLDQSMVGHTFDVVSNPYSVSGNLFLALDSAGWFWTRGKQLKNGQTLNLNLLADKLDTDRISVLVNGGGNGKKERNAITQKLLTFFNANVCIHQ